MKTLPRVRLLVLLLSALLGCRGADEPAPLGRLAFIRGDSLFVQSLPDGRAHLLALGPGLAQPRWSASGEWVASHAGGGLRITRIDGSGGQDLAPQAADFAWAPTDDRIAYIAEGNLVVARAGGMGAVLVARTRESAAEGVAWSQDGQRLALAIRPAPAAAGAGAASPTAPTPMLWSIPARGGAGSPLPLPALPSAGVPQVRGWTAAGLVLALLPADDPRVGAPATTAAPLFATGGGGPRRLAGAVLPYPDFVAPRPAGGLVALVAGDGPESWRGKVLMLASAGDAAALRVSPPGRAAISPAWSADGRRLAWVDMPEAALPDGIDAAPGLGARRIVLADLDGAGAIRATRRLGGPPGRQELPRWAADGRHLLHVLVDSTGAASVWLALDGGGAPRPVVDRLAPPAGADGWNGTRGHVAWDDLLDYWPGAPRR